MVPEHLRLPGISVRRCLRMCLAAVCALTLTLLLGVSLLPQPATASGAAIEVSVDRSHWADRLPRPFLSELDRIVPGDTQRDELWLRNATDAPVEVTVALRWAGPDEPTTLDDVLRIGLAETAAPVGQLREKPLRTDLGTLAPGEVVAVSGSAQLPLSAENPTQRQGLALDLVLQLSGPDRPTPGPTPSGQPSAEPTESASARPSSEPSTEPSSQPSRRPDRDASPLPRTGAEILVYALIGAGVLALGAAALLLTRRRRGGEAEADPADEAGSSGAADGRDATREQ